jgi:hypothetical protein
MKFAYNTPHEAIKAWLDRLMRTASDPGSSILNVYSKSRKVYADGHVMYSYGTHYPLIRWIPEYATFTVNQDRYSNTTSRHQEQARRLVHSYASALGYRFENSKILQKIAVLRLSYEVNAWLPDVLTDKVLVYYHDNIRKCALKAKRARSYWSRTQHLRFANEWIAERNTFVSRFAKPLAEYGITTTPELPEDVQATLVMLKLTEQ